MTVVIVDTNVWVSAVINPHGFPAQLVNAWLAGRFEVAISLPILAEIAEVLMRPRIKNKYKLSGADIDKFLSLLQQRARHVEIHGAIRLCRDPDDDLILETAISGHAQFLVSRDDDLKTDADLIAQMQVSGITVISVQQFLLWLEN